MKRIVFSGQPDEAEKFIRRHRGPGVEIEAEANDDDTVTAVIEPA